MVIDYWVFRRGKIIIPELYNPNGIYKYTGGFSIVGLVSFFAGILGEYIISAFQGTLAWYFDFIPVPKIELAWYYGFIIAAITHLILGFAAKDYVLPELKYVVTQTAKKTAGKVAQALTHAFKHLTLNWR